MIVRLPTGELHFATASVTSGESQVLAGREIASFALSLGLVLLTLWVQAG